MTTTTLQPGDRDFETSLSRILRDRKSESCTLRFDQAAVKFIAAEFALKENESVRDYVVLTGGSHGVWASTYEEYISEKWPDLAAQILEVLDVMARSFHESKPTTQVCRTTAPFSIAQHQLEIAINYSESQVKLDSSRSQARPEVRLSSRAIRGASLIPAVVNAVAWFFSTVQPTFRGLAYSGCSLHIRPSRNGTTSLGLDLITEYQASLLSHSLDWPSNCWMPLVPNFAVAGTHASRDRRHEIKGMELSFDLMCYLCGLEYEIFEGDGLVLYGENSMVYPVRQIGDCVEWHFEQFNEQAPSSARRGLRMSVTDLTFLLDRTRHFVGLWKDPVVTLGTEGCSPERLSQSRLPTQKKETNRDGFSIGGSIAFPKVLTLNLSRTYKTTSTRQSPYKAENFKTKLLRMASVPVLLYSESERRAWMVSFVSILWHLARAKAHTESVLGYSIPPCEKSSNGGEAARRKIMQCYKEPVRNDVPWEQLDADDRDYTIEVYLKEIMAALECTQRECYRSRGWFSNNKLLGYDMADIARPRGYMTMKSCSMRSSGPSTWMSLLDTVSTVLFCEDLEDPIVASNRIRSNTACPATKWNTIPKGFDILTASLPVLQHGASDSGSGLVKLNERYFWHVPGCSSSPASGPIFGDCSCIRGSNCHKLQEVRSLPLVRGLSSRITPPSHADLSNHEIGAVVFRHKEGMEKIADSRQARSPETRRVPQRSRLARFQDDRVSADPTDSGYSSDGSLDSGRTLTTPGRPQGRGNRLEVATNDRNRTIIKIHTDHISTRTLDHFHLPWEWEDESHTFLLVKQYVDDALQKKLFEHTRMLRDQEVVVYQPRIRQNKFSFLPRSNKGTREQMPRKLKRSNSMNLLGFRFW